MSDPPSATPAAVTSPLTLLPGAGILAATLGIVFAVQWALDATSAPGIVRMGARIPGALEGRTLLSSTWLHPSAWQVLANAGFALVVGSLVERHVGPWRTWLIFVVGALTGNVLAAQAQPDALGVGAAGGNWGLMIAELLLVLIPALRGPVQRVPWAPAIVGLIALNVVLSFVPGFGSWVHLVGGVGGGLALLVTHLGAGVWSVVGAVAVAAHALALAWALVDGRPWAVGSELSGPTVARTFFDGMIEVELPESLPVGEGEVVTYAGDLWRDGVSADFVIAHGEGADLSTLEQAREAYGADEGVPIDCGERCTGRQAAFEGGAMLGAARAYGTVWLVTVVVLADGAPPASRDWAREVLTAARLTEQGVRSVDEAAWDLEQNGDAAGAVSIREALVGDHPGTAFVLDQLAWTLATHPDDGLRDAGRATELARRAVSIERSASHLDTLAVALAEGGEREEATALLEEAVAMAPDDPEIARHLEAVRSELSLRE